MNRPDVVSYGVTESEVLVELLDSLSEDREADLIAAITKLEELIERAPLLLRILYHGLYTQYKPENNDVWLRVGAAVSQVPESERDDTWRHRVKSRAWRRAHPTGLEVEPPV